MGFIDFIKNIFTCNKELKKIKCDEGYHPEFLFLINKPYAEDIEFEEIS